MTLPPNRIGGVRGPNGATLDDVVALLGTQAIALDALASAVGQSNQFLEQLVSDLSRLTGSGALPSLWDGLPQYLTRVLGSEAAAIDEEQNLFALGLFQRQAALNMLLGLFGTTAPTALARLGWLLEVRNALIEGQGENVYSRVSETASYTLALLDSLGNFNDAPDGRTIKNLLDNLVSCCEEGNSGGGETFPPPTLDCAGQPVTWQEVQLELIAAQGPGGQDVYTVVWPATYPEAPTATGTSRDLFEGFQPGMTTTLNSGGPVDYAVCIYWHFSDTAPPYNMDAFKVPSNDNLLGISYTSYSGLMPVNDQKGDTPEMLTAGGVRFVYHANFAWDSGVTPIGKVWVAVSEIAA